MATTPTPTLLDCGHESTPSGCSAGYAIVSGGKRICYSCSDDMQRAEVANAKPGDRITLFVSSDGKRITTWPGGDVMSSVRIGALHQFSRDVHYLSAVDALGRRWTGTGAPGMYASLRLSRAQLR